jgi:hypothetical protein
LAITSQPDTPPLSPFPSVQNKIFNRGSVLFAVFRLYFHKDSSSRVRAFDANGPLLMSSANPQSLARRVCLSIFALAIVLYLSASFREIDRDLKQNADWRTYFTKDAMHYYVIAEAFAAGDFPCPMRRVGLIASHFFPCWWPELSSQQTVISSLSGSLTWA